MSYIFNLILFLTVLILNIIVKVCIKFLNINGGNRRKLNLIMLIINSFFVVIIIISAIVLSINGSR